MLKSLFEMATTTENNFNGNSVGPNTGVASFPLKIKNGKNIENIHPLIIYEFGSCVATVNGIPNPMKYGQFCSMYVKRLCSSQPILNHLYSNAYNEYKRHM